MSWEAKRREFGAAAPPCLPRGLSLRHPSPTASTPGGPPRRPQPVPGVCVRAGGHRSPLLPSLGARCRTSGLPAASGREPGHPGGSGDPRGSGTHQFEQLFQAGRLARCAVPEPSVIGERRGKHRRDAINWFKEGGCDFGLLPRNSPRTGELGGGRERGTYVSSRALY